MAGATGEVTDIIGVVLDAKFPEHGTPEIYNAIEIPLDGGGRLVAEVQQHLGNDWVRAVAMSTTDGLRRGMQCDRHRRSRSRCRSARPRLGASSTCWATRSTATARSIPQERRPIHRPAPSFADQSTQAQIFETGIKVIDLIAPFTKGGKTGIFGGAGVGKTVVIQELIANIAKAARATRSSPAWASAPARATQPDRAR